MNKKSYGFILLPIIFLLECSIAFAQKLTHQDSLLGKKAHWGVQINGGENFMTPFGFTKSLGWGYDAGLFLEFKGFRWHSQIELNYRSVSLNIMENEMSFLDPGFYPYGVYVPYNYTRKFIDLNYLVKYKSKILNNRIEFFLGPDVSILIHKKLFNSELSNNGSPYFPNYFTYNEPMLLGFETGLGIYFSKKIQWKINLNETITSFGVLGKKEEIQSYNYYSVPFDDNAYGKFFTLSTGILYFF